MLVFIYTAKRAVQECRNVFCYLFKINNLIEHHSNELILIYLCVIFNLFYKYWLGRRLLASGIHHINSLTQQYRRYFSWPFILNFWSFNCSLVLKSDKCFFFFRFKKYNVGRFSCLMIIFLWITLSIYLENHVQRRNPDTYSHLNQIHRRSHIHHKNMETHMHTVTQLAHTHSHYRPTYGTLWAGELGSWPVLNWIPRFPTVQWDLKPY